LATPALGALTIGSPFPVRRAIAYGKRQAGELGTNSPQGKRVPSPDGRVLAPVKAMEYFGPSRFNLLIDWKILLVTTSNVTWRKMSNE
jgi:hypothetical protein